MTACSASVISKHARPVWVQLNLPHPDRARTKNGRPHNPRKADCVALIPGMLRNCLPRMETVTIHKGWKVAPSRTTYSYFLNRYRRRSRDRK